MTDKTCADCKYSRKNNGRNEWCHYSEEGSCYEHNLWELYRNDYRQGTTPSSMEDCETRYPNVDDIPEGTCEKCGRNKIGGDCGHRPKKREAVIITHSRFYSPQGDEMVEQIVPFPVLMEE